MHADLEAERRRAAEERQHLAAEREDARQEAQRQVAQNSRLAGEIDVLKA